MTFEKLGSICFALAILHAFLTLRVRTLSLRLTDGSLIKTLLHLLGEVEFALALWSIIFLSLSFFSFETKEVTNYLSTRSFSEPLFAFVLVVVSSTKPILNICRALLDRTARYLPFNAGISFYLVTLVMGPLLGSFISEPAAITVTAILLKERLYNQSISRRFMYATAGLLFVNTSIGGTLTPFAAPPVLMVSEIWNWDLPFMFKNFGWKAIVAVLISTSIVIFRFRKDLGTLLPSRPVKYRHPTWVELMSSLTKPHQSEIGLKYGLRVAIFLTGLIILGGTQSWWLESILKSLSPTNLYWSAIGLTAFVDNATLTYLGSQVPDLLDTSKYALVAGSVVGGGLTIFANAPNPAGFAILNESFGKDGIEPMALFKAALLPTIVAAACFYGKAF